MAQLGNRALLVRVAGSSPTWQLLIVYHNKLSWADHSVASPDFVDRKKFDNKRWSIQCQKRDRNWWTSLETFFLKNWFRDQHFKVNMKWNFYFPVWKCTKNMIDRFLILSGSRGGQPFYSSLVTRCPSLVTRYKPTSYFLKSTRYFLQPTRCFLQSTRC